MKKLLEKYEMEDHEEEKKVKKDKKELLKKKTQRKQSIETKDEDEDEEDYEFVPKVTQNGKNGTHQSLNPPHPNNERKPFKRIDESILQKLPDPLKDNSYDNFMTLTGDDYGKAANEKLKFTKGRDFKKEKTKFKNKTSAGGYSLSLQSRSIKLEDDSD